MWIMRKATGRAKVILLKQEREIYTTLIYKGSQRTIVLRLSIQYS